jgi:hypothetical protein
MESILGLFNFYKFGLFTLLMAPPLELVTTTPPPFIAHQLEYTDKKEKKIFFMYKEFRWERLQSNILYEEGLLCNRSLLDFLILYTRKIQFSFFECSNQLHSEKKALTDVRMGTYTSYDC